MCKSTSSQLEEQIASLRQDNKTANSLIQRFQTKYQSTKAELKLSESYKMKKEQTIQEKDLALEHEREAVLQLKKQLHEKEGLIVELRAINKKQEDLLNGNKETMEKQENMIRYLNKANCLEELNT